MPKVTIEIDNEEFEEFLHRLEDILDFLKHIEEKIEND